MNNDIITEWNSMSTEEQIKLITACVRKAANKDVGSYATSQHGHEINEFINEAWERITNSLQPYELTACNKRRAAQGKEPITLVTTPPSRHTVALLGVPLLQFLYEVLELAQIAKPPRFAALFSADITATAFMRRLNVHSEPLQPAVNLVFPTLFCEHK